MIIESAEQKRADVVLVAVCRGVHKDEAVAGFRIEVASAKDKTLPGSKQKGSVQSMLA